MGKHLAPAKRMKIIEREAMGFSCREIAKEYGIPFQTVYGVIRKHKKEIEVLEKETPKNDIVQFNYETTLDEIAEQLYKWFRVAGMSKTGLQCADKFFLAYRAHKGQAETAVNIQATFIQMAPDAQLQLIQQSPQWSALVAEMTDVLAGCGTCPKVQELLRKIRGEQG